MNTPHGSEDAARSQIGFLKDTLQRTSRRYADVQNALLDATLAFEQAKRTLDAFTAEAESLDATMVALRSDISSRQQAVERASLDARAARVRRILAHFPRELLYSIFVHGMQAIEEEVWPENTHRALTFYRDQVRFPFNLASVNRQWRNLALHSPALWTFLGVGPLEGGSDAANLAYVDMMLLRSQRRPIDVYLGWAGCSWSGSVHYADIMDAVGRHANRWRRASITVPGGTPESSLHFLRLPMPALQGLALSQVDENWLSTSTPSAYLPFCPSLRWLDNSLLFTVPRSPLGKLTHFHICVPDSSTSHDVWSLFGMLPSVQEVGLDFMESGVADASTISPVPLTLSALRKFTIVGLWYRFFNWLAQLEMPVLQELRIQSVAIKTYSALFEKLGETVSTLSLDVVGALFPADYMPDIRKLAKLRKIVLHDCTAFGDDFSTVFASREAAGLPLLESIVIQEPALDEEGAAHVSTLMQSLHGARAASGAPAPLTLELVVAEAGNVPAWLLQQYQFAASQLEQRGHAEEDVGTTRRP